MRLELESMKLSMVQMLHDQAMVLDSMLKNAVDEYCKPENLRKVIETNVQRTLDAAIREEIEGFFRYKQEGREIIAEAVKKKLLDRKTYTSLDDAG